MSEPTMADVLADLNRAKCAFQLRAVQAVLGCPAQTIDARSGQTVGLDPKGESVTPTGMRHD